MRVPIGRTIIIILFTLIMLNANLATSSVQPGNRLPANQEITKTDEQPLSPRIAKLQAQLKSGDRNALDVFWKDIAERGAPIIAESNFGFRDSEIPDLRLAFIKDGKGNVSGLNLNTRQGEMLVKKMPPSVPSLTGNTTFTLAGHTDAEAVAIYGSFNNWTQTKNYCAKEIDGWVCRIDLAPGKYTYKFLIDGVGLNDPTNSVTENDGNGRTDSVIVIKPK